MKSLDFAIAKKGRGIETTLHNHNNNPAISVRVRRVKADTDSLKHYIFDFLQTRPVADINRAISLVPTIEKYSADENIDPHLTALIISLESSWHPGVKSKDGRDFGLMGIRKNGVCAKGQDLSTPEGQIRAGVRCLAMSRDACNGKLKQTLTMYASGKCKSDSARTRSKMKWRVFKYKRILDKYETPNDTSP